MKRARTAGRSAGSRSLRRRSRHSRQSGVADRAELTEIEDRADLGWVEWGGELIWAVGFTSGGAPFGLRPSDFSPTDLEAMGLGPGLAAARSPVEQPGPWPARDAGGQSGDAGVSFAPEDE